ncbi:MAG: radical SAM protein [Promethearchaeota archaeon]|nr:MAG: radical SAM protein [Candidatus Lokiarchaeota archaeon]
MSFKFLRPDSISVWKNEQIQQRFSYYRGIIDGKKLARYIIAKSLAVDFNEEDSTAQLENLLGSYSKELRKLFSKPLDELKNREIVSKNYISLAETLATRYLEECIFCERQCKVNRIDGEKGYCLISKDSYVSSVFPHMGEESPLIPSGTIFFLGCNFGCVFCQNADISQSWKNRRDPADISQKVDGPKLATLAETLESRGVININYVGGDPIPNIHTIIESLQHQKSNITQLWNSNFYLTEQSLNLLINLMDFWLPDFKYGNNDCANKYSGVENYYEILTRNLKKIHDLGSGEIIIRHLVMPNHVECCSKPILDFVAEKVPNCVVNIMGQYRPQYKAYDYPEINRRPSSEEMREVKNYAEKLNILYKPVS